MIIPIEIENYCVQHSEHCSEVARELLEYTRSNIHGHHMLIGELEAAVLTMLIKMRNVKHVLEFGTYTGFSALIMAEAISEEGTVTTIDLNPQTTQIAETFWKRSNAGHKIKLILKPGLEAVKELDLKYDLIFIDADKGNYLNYLKWSLEHVSNQGMIIVDNTLWYGKVLNPGADKQTDSIIAHNEFAKEVTGFKKVLLPIRDGMYVLYKG